ncbi:g11514 [Coccomyxa elongata]
MDHKQILSCQFGEWYPQFRDVAFRSRVVELPAAFAQYLVEDGVYLADNSCALPRPAKPSVGDDLSDWSDDDADECNVLTGGAEMPEFPELFAEIDAAIEELGGCVAPKLNWSAPHDAAWVSSSKSLACRNADEVILLLKSSDRVAHDICHAFDACPGSPRAPPNYQLALRKWIAMRPEREFRCFVQARDLIAVSQRNIMENAAFLEPQKDDLLEAMLEFFEEHVQQRFPEKDYTFDVYITTAGKVRLIDFNPIGGTTSPLLFDWAELPYSLPTQPASSSAHDEPSASGGKDSTGAPPNGRCAPPPEAAGPPSGPQGEPSQGEESTSGRTAEVLSQVGRHASDRADARENMGERGQQGDILFRLNTDGAVMRPSSAAYGAPYDMVDTSDGSAISELLRRLQTEEVG